METDENRRLAESMVKELCGGDTVKGRRMHEDFWSFRPSHTLILVTNSKPKVGGTDDGIWRRLRVVPFTQRFWDRGNGESGMAGLEADKRLGEKLRPELSGIVRWLVDACREWQRKGLQQPPEVTSATVGYREAMDVLGRFLTECCTLKSGLEIRASDLRDRYETWCHSNGERPVNNTQLGTYLAEHGVGRRTSNGVIYQGLTTARSGTVGRVGTPLSLRHSRAHK